MRVLKFSLKDKFVSLFIAMGVIAAGIVSGITYFLAEDALMSRTFDQLTSVKHVKQRQIENYFKNRLRDLDFLSDLIIDEYNHSEHPSVRSLELNYLDSLIKKNPLYRNYYLHYNYYGKKSFRTKFLTFSEEFDPIFKDALLIDSTKVYDIKAKDKDGKHVLFLAKQIKKDGKVIASLMLESTLEKINSIMLEQDASMGLGNSGESYLVGEDFLMRSTSRFQKESVMKTKVETDGVKRALEGDSGTDLFDDYRGVHVFSSYCKLDIQDLNWVLLAEIDHKEALMPIHKIRNYILFLTVSISILVFLIAYIISHQISKPLVMLRNAVQMLGSGDMNVQVYVKSNDEIGELSEAFNVMSKQLKKKNEELNAERLKQYSIATNAQDEERERLSRELHDGIGQTFIAIKLKLEQLFNLEKEEIEHGITDVEKSIDHAIEEIRRMSNNLMPSVLNEFGLENAIRRLLSDFNKNNKYSIIYDYNISYDISNKKFKIHLFRIIQEAINNIHKYSEADKIEIRVFENANKLNILISDNGKGFDLDDASQGTGAGLINIRERAKILGGLSEIKSKLGKGVEIQVNIPNEKLKR